MRRLLDEAVGREVHADALADLAVRRPLDVHVPTLRALAHSQRIRAVELRGSAAALSICKGQAHSPPRTDGRLSGLGQADHGLAHAQTRKGRGMGGSHA
ncbi:hypothetical protein GCM10007890_02560 [Methylobacterium tardum]|uniref:Uncharacterized protein n=1 Tax=Methylobacterium tardum TaxID=374432 RepID=A0AA37WPI6_9HYPH|nr:hypothetical protein GCM10007890_02560 [Methylobacterium tardum]